MTRYLITGAGGFIGKHLTAFLRSEEPTSDVVAVGREGNLTDSASCMTLFEQAGRLDYVFHLADVSGNSQWSAQHAGEQFLANARMSLNVLEAVQRHQAGARLIGFSTLWAYPAAVTLAREEEYWNGPLDASTQHYGSIKKLLGIGIQACRQQWGMGGTMLALGNVYGPGDRSDHVIPSLIHRMRQIPDRLTVWGDGRQKRDFIYVDDQVRAIYLHKNYNGALLNISGGRSHSIREVVETLAALMPYEGEIVFDASVTGGLSERRMDNSLVERETGWPGNTTFHTLTEGLSLTLRGMDKNGT